MSHLIVSNEMEIIREQDPLKQGLKQVGLCELLFESHLIREQDPLKQGLKLEETL